MKSLAPFTLLCLSLKNFAYSVDLGVYTTSTCAQAIVLRLKRSQGSNETLQCFKFLLTHCSWNGFPLAVLRIITYFIIRVFILGRTCYIFFHTYRDFLVHPVHRTVHGAIIFFTFNKFQRSTLTESYHYLRGVSPYNNARCFLNKSDISTGSAFSPKSCAKIFSIE